MQALLTLTFIDFLMAILGISQMIRHSEKRQDTGWGAVAILSIYSTSALIVVCLGLAICRHWMGA